MQQIRSNHDRRYRRAPALTVTVAVELAPPSMAPPGTEYGPGIERVATVSALPLTTGLVPGLNETRPPTGPRNWSHATRRSGGRGGLPRRGARGLGTPSSVTEATTEAPS